MSIELSHEEIPIEILDGPYVVDGRPTPEATKLYQNLVVNLPELRRFAADRLLALYNDSWLNDEIGALDKFTFVERLVNPSILVQDELGAALVYFEDGGTFGGHDIQITVENGSPGRVDIVG